MEGDSSTGDFEEWMKGVLWMEHLSPKRPLGEGLGGTPSLWTLEDMLGKSPYTASLSMGPLSTRAETGIWGRACILGTSIDE
jgi:hypothetical protein